MDYDVSEVSSMVLVQNDVADITQKTSSIQTYLVSKNEPDIWPI
jgi:hypothetical protein